MSHHRPLIIALVLLTGQVLGQLRVVKPVPSPKKSYNTSKLGIGLGRAQSVLFLMRNIKEDNEAHGWDASMCYNLTRVMKVAADYTWYKAIDIRPTWYTVRGRTLECNLHWLFVFPNGKTRFYPLTGISYNVFEGLFTGAYDHLNMQSMYAVNTVVRTRWLGVNAGTGMDYYLKPFSIYGEFKMRVGVSETNKQLTIMDVCLSAGIRYNLRVPSLHRLFSGTRSRYLLDVQED
jgi:hypothetical protein